MPFVRIRAIDVYYELHGTGPRVVLLSGSGADLRVNQRRGHGVLESCCEVLMYDQRGLGQTSKPGFPTAPFSCSTVDTSSCCRTRQRGRPSRASSPPDQIERLGRGRRRALVPERCGWGRNCGPHSFSRSTKSTGWQDHRPPCRGVTELGVVSDATPNWRVASAAMRISERVDNAVRAMGELAVGGAEPVKAETIANHQDSSLKYLLDILRGLKRAELVRSKRGPDGGFALSRPAAEISLADVFRAVDGPLADVHDESLRDIEYPAPLQALPQVWMAIRGSLRRVLETVSVADLVSGDLPDGVVEIATEYRATTEARFGR